MYHADPLITAETEFFWTSGKDGRLRVQACTNCGTLRHPPGPVCAECGSFAHAPRPVSGRATVVGVTVNHHQWSPHLPTPYLVAIVALQEDNRVRLTTNIVDCAVDEVQVGTGVAARFDRQFSMSLGRDIWVPVFTPIAGAEAGPVPPVEDRRDRVRPMVRAGTYEDKFEHKALVAGAGVSRIGRRLMADPLALTVAACRAAIADAGLGVEDIDGIATYPGSGILAPGYAEGGAFAVEEALRLRPTWISGGPETPGQVGQIVNAMMAVASGLCRHVLCFRTVWEATAVAYQRDAAAQGRQLPELKNPLMAWQDPFGASSAATIIAMYASNYFHHFGADRQALGWIALTARANAARNPEAIYRDPLTMDDYLSARMISSPFGLYDCDVPCDGAIAVVVSAAQTRADLRAPVRVEAVGTQILDRISWDQDTITHEPQVIGPAAHLWTRTDLKPADVGVALLYDGFTFNCLSWLEALGFCDFGEGPDFVAGGRRIGLGGELPLNTHGGQLSAGRTHGYGFVLEAVRQLRGEAEGRQVDGAEVAVVSTGGGTPGGCLLLTR
jgi:acetyl-CoA acetyltransferase/uncharacterized OB-fold protein